MIESESFKETVHTYYLSLNLGLKCRLGEKTRQVQEVFECRGLVLELLGQIPNVHHVPI